MLGLEFDEKLIVTRQDQGMERIVTPLFFIPLMRFCASTMLLVVYCNSSMGTSP